jgi:hypothetical protein
MARKNRNAAKRKAIVPIEELIAPTPEQMLHGSYVAQFIIDDATGLKGLVHVNEGGEINGRLFKLRHFDRLNKAGCFTRDQYLAGKWYRDAYERGRYDQPQTSNLHRVQGSVGSSELVQGGTQNARDGWRAARMSWPSDMTGFMDALILRNSWPKMHHRERARTLSRICEALDCLSKHLQNRR